MVKKIASYLLLSLVLVACQKNPLTGKSQFTLIPETTLMAMANQEYLTFLSSSKVVASTSNRDAEMVKRVGNRIIKAVETYYAEKGASSFLADFKWEVNLVDDKTVNAWCMPGGKIVVYTGILPITQNEAALAAVMGHEVCHALLRHGNQRMSSGLVQQFGGVALQVALANKPQETQNLFMTAYGVGSAVGVMLPFSRKHELQSDQYGLLFTAMAGYNPIEAIGLWERMEKASNGQKPPEFLSTHPSEGRRIEEIKAFMPEAMKVYKPISN